MLKIQTGAAIERPQIEIDGTLYELVSPDELSVVDRHRLAARGRQIDRLMAKDELQAAEKVDLASAIEDASNIVLAYVPSEVRGRLSDSHRLQILDSFTTLMLRERLVTMAAREDKHDA